MPSLPSFTDDQLLQHATRLQLLPADATVTDLTPALRNVVKRRLLAGSEPPAPSTARTVGALYRELLDEHLPEPLAAAITLEAARLEVRRLHLAAPPTTT